MLTIRIKGFERARNKLGQLGSTIEKDFKELTARQAKQMVAIARKNIAARTETAHIGGIYDRIHAKKIGDRKGSATWEVSSSAPHSFYLEEGTQPNPNKGFVKKEGFGIVDEGFLVKRTTRLHKGIKATHFWSDAIVEFAEKNKLEYAKTLKNTLRKFTR